MQTPFFLRLFGPNVLHHNLGPQTHASHSVPISMHYFTVGIIIFLFLYLLHCIIYRMRHTLKWEASLNEDKKVSKIQKEDFIYSKTGQCNANLISRIEFVSLISYKFLPFTAFYFLIACIYDVTCHFFICACDFTKDNRYCACQTAVS